MKTYILIINMLMAAIAVNATDFTETFTGLKSTDVTNGTHTLTLGDWQMQGMSLSSSQLKFNGSPAYIISPKLNKISKLSFAYRSGGSNKVVTVSYSTDGSTWTDLTSFTIASSSSTFATWSKETGLGDKENLQFRISATSNTYIKNFKASDDVISPDAGYDPNDSTYKTEGTWIPTKPFPTPLHTYYISPGGNDDTGDGSFDHPWYNIAVAYSHAAAGDAIICRGGKYTISKYGTDGKLTVRMNKNGTADNPIVIRCYDGEIPVFDFVRQLQDCNRDRSKVGDRGILLTGDYHWLYGISIMHAADNGIKLEGSHNRIERCELSYNLDSGIQLGFGHDFSAAGFGVSKNDGSYCSYNDIIDCDSHHNCDFDMNYGSDADGFACKMHNGKGNRFIRCRSWRNGDDAWDLYETDYSVVIAECWAWESGNAEDHTWVKDYLDGTMSFSGNGNGIKLGGNGSGGSSAGIHYAYDCIAFGCDKSGSVKGFDCNSHKGGHVLIGCLGFDNGYDYMFESGGSDNDTYFYNNVCLGRQEICVGTDNYNALNSAPSKNGWVNNVITGASKDDYLSLDETEAVRPRALDGSFPRLFGRLKSSSQLVDAGNAIYDIPEGDTFDPLRQVIADYPFLKHSATGKSRDLGPYERPETTSIKDITETHYTDMHSYNLSGQHVSDSYKGIIIKNGYKYIMSRH